MKTKVILATMAMGLWVTGLLVAPAAMAVALDFDIPAFAPGTITYAGGASALIGSGIGVDSVTADGTPANANVAKLCVNCALNFTTGAWISAGGANANNNGWWRFGPGGTITITGGVILPGSTNIPSGSPLLTGSFSSAFVQDLGGNFKVTFGSFTDTKDDTLLSYFGLTPGTPFQGALTILFTSANTGIGNAFSSTTIFSGNVGNTPVPLPAAALLFGSGLLGLAGALRKKLTLA